MFYVRTEPGVNTRFTFSKRNWSASLKNLMVDQPPLLRGLTGGIGEYELLFADSANNVVRSYYLHSQTIANIFVPRSDNIILSDVAYSSLNDTLFVGTLSRLKSTVFVRSFQSYVYAETEQWINLVRRHKIPYNNMTQMERISLRVLLDGTLLCGVWGSNTVHVCHGEIVCKQIQLQANHFGFDVQQIDGKGTRLAVAFANSIAIFSLLLHNGIYRAVEQFIKPLVGARNPLFSGNMNILLVGVASNGLKIQTANFFIINGEGQETELELIGDYPIQGLITYWCFYNQLLYAWDSNAKQLLSFQFSYANNANQTAANYSKLY